MRGSAIAVVSALFIAIPSARAQAPAGPTFDVDIADTALLGLGFWAVGLGVGAQDHRFTGTAACRRDVGPEQLCNPDRIFVLDRPTYGHRWRGAAPASDVLLLGMLASPVGYAGIRVAADGRVEQPAETFGRSAAVSVQALGAVLLATNVLKLVVRRPRPLTYDPEFRLEKRLEGDARLSFPSGHTSMAFGAATVLSVMIAEETTDPGVRAAGIGAAFGAATLVGYLRIAARRHFLTDVLAGAALGAGLAYLVAGTQLAEDDGAAGEDGASGFRFAVGGTF